MLMLVKFIFSSPEPKAQGELIGWESSGRPSILSSVCPSVRLSTLSNMNISEISRLIVIKFHQKHHWGRELTPLGFGPDRNRTLVSMATDSSHRIKTCDHSNSFFLIGSSLFLQLTRTTIKSWIGSKLGSIRRRTYELAALERLEKSP